MDYSITDIEIELNGVKYPNPFSRDVSIDCTALDDECSSHAQKLSYYGTLAALAEDAYLRQKAAFEDLKAVLDSEKRAQSQETMRADPKAKFTEAMFENLVKGDNRYRKQNQVLLDAKLLMERLSNNYRSFQDRKDMLKECAATNRMATDLRVKDDQVKHMFKNK